jgi:hypothetical protein
MVMAYGYVICFAETNVQNPNIIDLDAWCQEIDHHQHHDWVIVSDTILLASCDHRPSTIMLWLRPSRSCLERSEYKKQGLMPISSLKPNEKGSLLQRSLHGVFLAQ